MEVMEDRDDDEILLSALRKKKGGNDGVEKASGGGELAVNDLGKGAVVRAETVVDRVERNGKRVFEDTEDDDVPLLSLKKIRTGSKNAKPKGAAVVSNSIGKGTAQAEDVDDLPLTSLKKRKEPVLVKKSSTLKRPSSLEDDRPLSSLARKRSSGSPNKRAVSVNHDDDLPLSSLKKKKSSGLEQRKIVPLKNPSAPKKVIKIVKKLKPQSPLVRRDEPRIASRKSDTPVEKKTVVRKAKPKAALKSKNNRLSKAKTSNSAAPSSVDIRKEEYVFVGGGEEDGERRWWQENMDGNEHRWQSLSHHGVLFPPLYEPVRVPLIYNGEEIVLHPAAEEVAMFYAAKLATDYVKKDVFNKNFFSDFKQTLRKNDRETFKRVKDFRKCDFSRMQEHLEAKKAEKKAIPAAERKKIREEEAERVKKYTVASVDGKEEKVGNFRIEPPALFLGRGEHPLMGKVKKRIWPEDITINIGPKDPVPECPIPGHKWGKVIHNKCVTWLAFWRDTITNGSKYVWLAADSKFKTVSDAAKFEKARKLHMYIEKIRKDYRTGWKSEDELVRQRSVALYLIDRLALRVGNEKGEDEADTVGCCSLRVEHLTFNDPDVVEFNFLGKDSIRYENSVKVERGAYLGLKKLSRKKKSSDDIFNRLTTSSLNEYLRSLMDGLTAKVFRTYNASLTLDRLLQQDGQQQNVNEQLVFYNQQNKEVAILCNHQRSLPKKHDEQMGKLSVKYDETIEWLRELERAATEMKYGRKDSADVTQWVHVKPDLKAEMTEEQRTAERKRAAEAPREKVVKRMKADSVHLAIARVHARIDKMKSEMQTKEDLKTVALGTSKQNYLDPRISVAWCKRNEVPLEKVFSKSLYNKFAWAMEASQEFSF
uniref:DNA topoisomerase I n=1 Tax=Rhodosorus marinus TaxID=101924 RepID=A0A7S3A1E7_9RHOD